MALVKMHKASDGSLHETFDAFAKREAELKIGKAVEAATFNMEVATSVDGYNGTLIDTDDLASFITANAEVLRDILNSAVVPKRGRKTAAAAPVAA